MIAIPIIITVLALAILLWELWRNYRDYEALVEQGECIEREIAQLNQQMVEAIERGKMSLYKRTGQSTLDKLGKAREALSARLVNGEPMKLGHRVDVLPPPREVGDIIFGGSLREYNVVTMDSGLKWQSTGKTALDYCEEGR